METVTTFEGAAFESVTVPEDAAKSPGAFAEPGAVAQLTWREQHGFGGGATWIVKEAVVDAPVPSVTVASEIVTDGVGAAVAGDGRVRTSNVAATVPAMRRQDAEKNAEVRPGRPARKPRRSMREQSAGPRPGWIPVPGRLRPQRWVGRLGDEARPPGGRPAARLPAPSAAPPQTPYRFPVLRAHESRSARIVQALQKASAGPASSSEWGRGRRGRSRSTRIAPARRRAVRGSRATPRRRRLEDD